MAQSLGSIAKLINGLGYRHSPWQTFSDFVEASALSISNSVDWPQREKREDRYMQLIKRYEPKELAVFPQILAELVMALEEAPSDVLGRAFHELELQNKWVGQFFSPYPICQMMAQMTTGDTAPGIIESKGFITAMEPACGSGAMVIAMAQTLKDAGINYQQNLHVTAVDIDLKCVHMAYTQLSLLSIPAVVVHGNSLTLEEHSHWYTPAHIMGGWDWRLKHPRPEFKPTPALTHDMILPHFEERMRKLQESQ